MTSPSATPDRLTPPAVNEIGPLAPPSAEISVLSNGLTLHVVKGGTASLTSMSLLLPGGIAESPQPRLFMLASRLLPEGSKPHPGEELAEVLEDHGAAIGTRISNHHNELTIACLSSNFDAVCPLLLEAATLPEYSTEAIDKVKRSMISSLEISMHEVAFQASRRLKEMVYPAGSPYIPSPDLTTLSGFSSSQIRDAHSSWMEPSHMHLFLAGRLTDRMVMDACSLFSKLPVTETPCEFNHVDFDHGRSAMLDFTPMPEAVQNAVAMAIPTIGRQHPDYVPLRAAVIALGGYFGSRLSLNIREEKGLTYGISAQLIGYPEVGYISIESETDPTNVVSLIEEVKEELDRMKDPSTFSSDEITRLRLHMLSDLARQTDSPFGRSIFLVSTVTAGIPDDYFASLEYTARHITPQLISSAAEKYFRLDRMFISVAGAPVQGL